jgi:salicylate hydroxylase
MRTMAGMVIVGGGLAGLAAAHALAQFGIQADVFEAAPALGEIGAAVNVAPNATQALIAIGLGEKIAAVGTRSPGIYTRNMQTGACAIQGQMIFPPSPFHSGLALPNLTA